jgi:uncharacterized lipoprotein YddW (UPF0748 family)
MRTLNPYRLVLTIALLSSVPSLAAVEPDEELRALFVTTAHNTDWPSQPGLHENIQKQEIEAIIQRAIDLNCNAIFLQVRAYGGRMHEPHPADFKHPHPHWANELNHTSNPGYQPLGRWIKRCHANNLQLHAWINPFRTDFVLEYRTSATDTPANTVVTLPFFASSDGQHMYLDPSSAFVQSYLIDVAADLLAYRAPQSEDEAIGDGTDPGDEDGIDGIVIDHYFPDPATGEGTPPGDFRAQAGIPTSAPAKTEGEGASAKKAPNKRITWLLKDKGMLDSSGNYIPRNDPGMTSSRFVQTLFNKVEEHGRTFGITCEKDQYNTPPATMKDWLQSGWCHYFLPELYYEPDKGFKAGLDAWITQNTFAGPETPPRKVLIIPVLFAGAMEIPDPETDKLWKRKDLEDEIDYARDKNAVDKKVHGQAFYPARSLRSAAQGGPPDKPMDDAEADRNIGDKLKKSIYTKKVLRTPSKPGKTDKPTFTLVNASAAVEWTAPGGHYWRIAEHHTTDGWKEWQHRSKKEDQAVRPQPGSGIDKIKVQAFDKHNRPSDEAEYTW